jgi:hypothetical protein
MCGFANDKEQYSYPVRFVICVTLSLCYSEFSYKLNTQKSNRQAHCSIRAISYRCKFGKLSMFKRKWETLTSSKITSSNNHFVENHFVKNHFVKIQKDGKKTSGGSLRRKRQSMAAWVRVLAI